MAIQIFNEIREGSGGNDQARNRVRERNFQVVTDDPTNGAGYILDWMSANILTNSRSGPDLSVRFSVVYVEYNTAVASLTYTDPNSVLVDYKVRQSNKDDLNDWLATCYYAGKDDPTAEPAEIDMGDIKWQEAIIEDEAGNPVVNSAGDPLESGLLVDRTRITLTIIKNVIQFDPIQALFYGDSLNLVQFLPGCSRFYVGFPGFDSGTCKLSSCTAKSIQRTDQSTFYWQAAGAVIEIKLGGWNIMVRDAGYRCVDINGSIIGENLFSNGTRPSTPFLLDGNGDALAQGNPPVAFPPGGFVGYPSLDWSPLGLDNL